MLRAGDFSETNIDTRAMPFPRIGVPDNPGWFPRGLSLRSLRNPLRNGRLFLRHKWNASRADVWTFLGLKQPAWASDDLLTLVSMAPSEGGDEAPVIRRVLEAHYAMLAALQAWRAGEAGDSVSSSAP